MVHGHPALIVFALDCLLFFLSIQKRNRGGREKVTLVKAV
jgi:hypothetical protein